MNIDFCEKYDMLPRSGRILCAVSGGKDSMYLLEALLSISDERSLNVQAAHFNHRLRGAFSDRDECFVRDYCHRKGVVCHVGSGDVLAYARENSIGIEEAARVLRYEFLEKTADETGADRIATAHTADDNAETILFNLARGSGLKGLCGIPPVRGRIVRPILTVTTAQVLKYLEDNGILHVEDETNGEEIYTRNKIRIRVVPELQTINSGLAVSVLKTAELLRQDEELLSSLAREFTDKNYKNGELSASSLTRLPRPVSSRALQIISQDGLSASHIEAILALASGKSLHGFADIPRMRVARVYDRLKFGYYETAQPAEREIKPGESLTFSEAGLNISCRFIPECEEIHNSFNTFSFKSDSICGNITVGPRLEGEKIRLLGRGCTKSLKKLFSEARLNGDEKKLVPVFRDNEGPIAVFGFGVAERCAPQSGDDVIVIYIKPVIGDEA